MLLAMRIVLSCYAICHLVSAQIFPPGFHPGEVIDDVDDSKLSDVLGDVHRAASFMENRACAIALANDAGHELKNPRHWLKAGFSHSALPVSIPEGHSGLILFTKRAYTVSGTSGMLTYDIGDTGYCVSIMFEIVELTGLYTHVFNQKVYECSSGANRGMFNQMYDFAGRLDTSQWHHRTEFGVDMLSSMTMHNEANLIIHVGSAGFDQSIGPHLHAVCNYHWLEVGNFCRLEKSPLGTCFTDVKCGSEADCNAAELPCLEDW